MAEAAVVAEQLVKRFGSFTAVDHLSFDILAGEIFGFLGPNGSGKSTTIRMLCGLLLPTEGDARVEGVSVAGSPETVRKRIGYMSQQFSLYGDLRIGYMSQQFSLYGDLTVRENMEFYGGAYGIVGPSFRSRAAELVSRLGLGSVQERLASGLSTGVRQRLALACALLHEPPVLFLDEPTSGVDPIARRSFFELIAELSAQGVTTLITTHVMEEAEHCNRLLLIYQGRRVALGKPADLKGLVPGQLMEVRVTQTMQASDVLQKTPGITEVSLFGAALHAAVADEVPAPEALIREALARADLSVQQVRPVRPTLEHAFLALAGDEPEEVPV